MTALRIEGIEEGICSRLCGPIDISEPHDGGLMIAFHRHVTIRLFPHASQHCRSERTFSAPLAWTMSYSVLSHERGTSGLRKWRARTPQKRRRSVSVVPSWTSEPHLTEYRPVADPPLPSLSILSRLFCLYPTYNQFTNIFTIDLWVCQRYAD